MCRRAALLLLAALCILPPALSWGQLGGQFEFPYSVAVGGVGNLYVTELLRHRVTKLNPQGVIEWQRGSQGSAPDQFNGPAGIAVDTAGGVYVADTYNARVRKLDAAGASVTQWGSYGTGQGQFRRPTAIAVDSSNNVYVLDSELRRVQKFSNDGVRYLGTWGTVGSGDGQFVAVGGGPRDIVIDPAGNAYITDTSGYRIHKWQIASDAASGAITSATFMGWMGRCLSGTGCDVASARSRGFSCNNTTCPNPAPPQGTSTPGTGDGQFTNPFGLAFDSQGNLFVADFDNNRVQKFDSTGNFVTKWGTLGTGPQEFRGPIDVAAFGTTVVYVADMRNKRVLKFTNTGAPQASFGGDIYLTATPGYPAYLDALVDPDPLFLFPSQAKNSTVTVGSLALFSGNVTLTQSPPRRLTPPFAAPLAGVTVGLSAGSVQLQAPPAPSATVTLNVSTTATPSAGRFMTPIVGTHPSGISRLIEVGFQILPAVPADSTVAPCPGFYQRGQLPYMVLPLAPITTDFHAVKAANPTKVEWFIGIGSAGIGSGKTGWQVHIEKATGLNPPLTDDEALVVFENPTRPRQGIYAIDGRSCLPPAGTAGLVLDTGESGQFRISTSSTTTLVLSEPLRDLVVFSEPPFWMLFGGRKVTIRVIGPREFGVGPGL